MSRIRRTFWHIDGVRWVIYFGGDVAVAMTREELDVREVA